MDDSKVDYKQTLNLPNTDFPMKADLQKREPELLAAWDESRLYARILDARRGAPPFVLHDGPPYANGHLHYGHILNKILKDVVCKFKTMAGRYVEYKPGWDCHGLPIELAVVRELGDQAHSMSPVEIRRACSDYARKFIDVQRTEFKRLGVFGTWDSPYRTLDKSYEATIVRELAGFAEQGLLFRALKPVHWCTSDKTALAEAEIEYDDAHVSPSIYVKFAFADHPSLFAVIWTTTPWTLPANLAVAYHPKLDYVAVRARRQPGVAALESYVVAKDLADAFVKACELVEEGPRQPFSFADHATEKLRHPFLDRESVLLPAEHVTLEQGTGLVHTAPGHGADDYVLGKKHGLPVLAPVDDAGRFTEGTWKGLHVLKANPAIVAALHESGALLSPPSAKITHAYPICWRCKHPVIFRATWQWFAKMDRTDGEQKIDLRKIALAEIGRTAFIPPWGENRIRGMIENRPDWVLSRQRVWGVPIPVLYRDGEAVTDATFMRRMAELFAEAGADVWFDKSAAELAALGGLAPGGGALTKGSDIVDVWFESGVSWAAVCEKRPGLDSATPDDPRPVDLYLEGSDQHRGWFHSALLTSCATRGRAPYRAVLTHGFVLDDRGRPYSKSEIEKARREGKKVEFIPPEEVLKQQGAELLRLWVAQADFRSDVAYSRAHLTQLGESYRKIRNTARFLLGNLADFDPRAHLLPRGELTDLLDRYVDGRTGEFERRIFAAYEAFEFHVVLRTLIDFCAVDLSSLYLDVRKDRLYCDPAASPARRAAQSVLYRALGALTTCAAPILCFTAEEIWRHIPGRPVDSVHLALAGRGFVSDAGTNQAMELLLSLRSNVQKELEPFRAQKKSSLDARVLVQAPAAEAAALRAHSPAWLADLLIVSQVEIAEGAPAIRVEGATGHKCARCWKVTADPPPLCQRCAAAVERR